MPMSVNMKAVFEKMEEIDQYVRKNGLGIIPAGMNNLARFNHKVMVRHEDGSTMFFEDAYAVLWENSYLIVYTEHNDNHIFHVGEITDTMGWSMYHKTEIPTIKERTWESHMKPHFSRLGLRDKVRTNIDPKLVSNDWSDTGERRHDAEGVVVKVSDAHGLCYKVKYEDGNTGLFDPWEVLLVESADQKYFTDPNDFSNAFVKNNK